MSSYVKRSGLKVDSQLADFVENEALVLTGVDKDKFWSGFSDMVKKAMPRNVELLARREELQTKIDEILAIRASKHPVKQYCAGSFFKNIPDSKEKYGKLPVGRLLEEIGAKNMSVGGAKVFEKHANIIINDGTAKSKDIRELADILKKKVFDTFGITLEDEVISIGDFREGDSIER